MTMRRRLKKMLKETQNEPVSARRRIELEGVQRIYKPPRVLDQKIHLKDYEGQIRQLAIDDLGYESQPGCSTYVDGQQPLPTFWLEPN